MVKPDWNWRHPYGVASPQDEPAVHITFDEAMAYCEWRGQSLPSCDICIRAGHTELRSDPPTSFQRGMTYEFLARNSSDGANCFAECVADLRPIAGKRDYSLFVDLGFGHAPARETKVGGQWSVRYGSECRGMDADGQRAITSNNGGSCWYGADQMRSDYGATKPRDMAVVYVGCRCIAE